MGCERGFLCFSLNWALFQNALSRQGKLTEKVLSARAMNPEPMLAEKDLSARARDAKGRSVACGNRCMSITFAKHKQKT
jgi:hypothetical protein